MHKVAFVIIAIGVLFSCSTPREARPYQFSDPHSESYFDENDLAFLPDLPSVDPKDLKTENMRVTIVRSSGDEDFPFIEFDSNVFADYSEYDVCQDDGQCVADKTLKNQVLPKAHWSWPLTVRVRACVRAKRTITPNQNCGPWSIKRVAKK